MDPSSVGDDTTLLGNGDSGDGEVTSDHKESDTGTSHDTDGFWDVGSRRIHQSDKPDYRETSIELSRDIVGERLVFHGWGLGHGCSWDRSLGEEEDSLTFGGPRFLDSGKTGDGVGGERQRCAACGIVDVGASLEQDIRGTLAHEHVVIVAESLVGRDRSGQVLAASRCQAEKLMISDYTCKREQDIHTLSMYLVLELKLTLYTSCQSA